jgi:hypothetical protein
MGINLLGDEWTSEIDRPGYRWRRMRIAGERLGASLYELPPGERTWKYHYQFRRGDAVEYWASEDGT